MKSTAKKSQRWLGLLPHVMVSLLAILLSKSLFAEQQTPTVKAAGISTDHSDKNPLWAVCYACQPRWQDISDYHLLVLDPDNRPNLKMLRQQGSTVLGYISLGEIHNGRHYFQKAKQAGWLLKPNPNWQGSYLVDQRNPDWGSLVIEELIPNILSQGFDGIFIDTVDSSIHLEATQPNKYAGTNHAAIELIQAIRRHYPNIKIMLNRAFSLLDSVAEHIDYSLSESLISRYNFATEDYEWVPSSEYKPILKQLDLISQQHPDLVFYSLDYWQPTDTATMKKIYRMQKKHGFLPYVATVELNQFIKQHP